MAEEMRAMSREGRAPRLVEPDEMVPPLLYVVSREADAVNGWRFDANLGTRDSRPPKPPTAPAAPPASNCTCSRLDQKLAQPRGHFRTKAARRVSPRLSEIEVTLTWMRSTSISTPVSTT